MKMLIQTFLLYVPLTLCYVVQAIYSSNHLPICPTRCTCVQKKMIASCKELDIRNIPTFPVFVKRLFLIRCHGELSSNSFVGVENNTLTTLAFRSCNITLKNSNILASLSSLKVLIFNHMPENQLQQILIGVNKTKTGALYVEHMVVKETFNSGTFEGLLGSEIGFVSVQAIEKLLSLDRALEYLENVTTLQLESLPSLETVNFTYLKSLTMLITRQLANFQPNLCKYSFTNIKTMDVDGSKMSFFSNSTKCLTNLTHLAVRNVVGSQYLLICIPYDFFNNLISLSVLKIATKIYSNLQILSPSSQALSELQIENLQIASTQSFNFTNLKNLTLKGVVLDSSYLSLLNNIPNVKSLYLIDNRIDKFPNDLLNLFPKLKYLRLKNNKKTSWMTIFQNSNCSLEILDIRSTSLTVLNENDVPNKVLKNLKQLYAGTNPLSCDCDNRWFRDYIDKNKQQFERIDNIGYVCQTPSSLSGTSFLHFHVSVAQCLHLIEIIVPCCIFLSLIFIIGIFLRKKMYTLYLFYMIRKKQLRANACQNFEYDGFVSYCDEDREWVHRTLVTTLEQGNQFKLCIHFRNFEPGKFIIDNIVDCMNKSRKIILVLSRKFFKSDWCILELEMAKERMVREGVDSLLLIILPNLKYSNVQNKFIISIMNIVTYAEYNSNNDENKDFWRQIFNALKHHDNQCRDNINANETTPLLSLSSDNKSS